MKQSIMVVAVVVVALVIGSAIYTYQLVTVPNVIVGKLVTVDCPLDKSIEVFAIEFDGDVYYLVDNVRQDYVGVEGGAVAHLRGMINRQVKITGVISGNKIIVEKLEEV